LESQTTKPKIEKKVTGPTFKRNKQTAPGGQNFFVFLRRMARAPSHCIRPSGASNNQQPIANSFFFFILSSLSYIFIHTHTHKKKKEFFFLPPGANHNDRLSKASSLNN
jgi:hypothetical protein